jgi:hypothetical protein
MYNTPSPLSAPSRYTRSIHLSRDFNNDYMGVNNYQITPLVIQTTERIIDGLHENATSRAFSLIGPYGAGKSAFGVFLGHYFRATPTQRRERVNNLYKEHDPFFFDAPQLLPVLVSGNNESLRRAILKSLLVAFESFQPVPEIASHISFIVSSDTASEIDPQQLADFVHQASLVLQETTVFRGIVLIIDELGQFLDFADRTKDERDLFVLQTLAEMAARSSDVPCILLTILHQSFERYAATAGITRRIEWAKVQGRFIDIPFQEPPVQMLRMVGQALHSTMHDVQPLNSQEWALELASTSSELGLQPVDIDSDEWLQLIEKAYPLHPTVLVALPLLFRQLAQNERSLFAFLCSYEPWSVQDVIRSTWSDEFQQNHPYRLTHLYAYIHATFGSSLFGRARGQRWAELAEAVALLPQPTGALADVLIVIGVLGALGQGRGVRANRKQIAFALRGLYDDDVVEATLNELVARKHITYRPHRDSFVIWEGSDLNVDELLQTAKRDIGEDYPLIKLLEQYVDTTPLVARRHSYQTGAVRYFVVRFVDAQEIANLPPVSTDIDGEVLYLAPTDEDALLAVRTLVIHSENSDPRRLIVLPHRVQTLRDLLMDVASLQQVFQETPELENDRVARREVSSRLVEAQQLLEQTISETYTPGASHWYWCRREVEARTAREVDELLSRVCDEAFYAAPRIWNELIVRRQVSSAGAKARRVLIEAMLSNSHHEALAITGYPPERAIYESVLHASGIHRQHADGVWHFGAPLDADPLHLNPSWQAIEEFFRQSETALMPLSALYTQLQAPPFGIKVGLVPLLFMAAYCAHIGEISLYEHENYVPIPDISVFERLLRQPGYFGIRRSRTSGMRIAVYERLARALAPKALKQPVQPAILDSVTPLLRLLKTLEPYSRTTRSISKRAQDIRQALIDARAPDELLFEKLPQACGFQPFSSDGLIEEEILEQFFTQLREGLQELQGAYPRLLMDIQDKIRLAFGIGTTDSLQLRIELNMRFKEVDAVLNDIQLRAFGVRLENADEDEAWIESIAALVARKPPNSWTDADTSSFELHITDYGRRLKVIEEVALTSGSLPDDSPVVRIGISDSRGEKSTVFRLPKQNSQMDNLFDELNDVLARYDTLTVEQKTAVLTDLLQPHLELATDGNGK